MKRLLAISMFAMTLLAILPAGKAQPAQDTPTNMPTTLPAKKDKAAAATGVASGTKSQATPTPTPAPQVSNPIPQAPQVEIDDEEQTEPTATKNETPSSPEEKLRQGQKTPPISAPQVPVSPSQQAGAQQQRRRVSLNPRKAIRLNYGIPSWNLNPAKIDSGAILMREASSGRIVQIHLDETEPDSAIFSGLFSIGWANIDNLSVEFYIPPQNLLASADGLTKVTAMIAKGELRRLPFIVHKPAQGPQTVEIFDTVDQARKAMRAYRNEQQVAVQNKKFPTDSQVEMAKLTAALKAKEEAAKAEAERVRLEQIAQRQAAEQLAKFNAMVAAEKEARIKKAAETATEALSLYHQGKFPEAKAKFEEATKLDPANKAYYYQYAVSLYRTEDFNKAVVFFNLAQGDGVDQTEKNFFLGLAYFRLKNYENSLASFENVIATKHKDMAPSASFYKGIILFEQKKWSEAQAAFQAVLDTSKDNALDERAEAYVERILRIQQFELERSRKWQFTFMAGEQLDSNVLLQSDNLGAASSTGKEGYRTLLTGSGRYRPVYDETTEFAIQLDALTMYTVDRTYQVAQSLRNADPTVATLTLPWAHKGLLFGKGYKLDVIPGYESTWMSIEDNTNKVILASTTLAVNNLLVMRDNWFANYNIEFRNDQSQLKSSIGDDNSNALKAKFAFNNLIFVSDDKAKIVTANAAYTQNQAVGKNNIFNRVDLAVGYIQPTVWDMSFNTSLAYYLLNYPQKSTARVDSDYTLNIGLNKKINDTWSTGVATAYTINNSTDESNQYSKYTIMLTLSALTAF